MEQLLAFAFASVLFTRILVAVFMVSVAGLVVAIGVSIANRKKNKQKVKNLSNTKAEKNIQTEKEHEEEKEEVKEKDVEDVELDSVTEFEHNGVKYVKYQYGESQCVCKGENSSKWITFAQKLQNSGKLESSKNVVNSTLVINKEDVLECFITGEKQELSNIAEQNLKEYKTEIKDIQNQQEAEVAEKTEEVEVEIVK